MAIPTGFFDKVVAEIGKTYQVTDGEGYNVETDPVVRLCAKLAYQQICSYLKASLHREQRVVVYPKVYGPLMLMHSPIDLTQPITVEVNFAVLPSTDYCIEDGMLYLSSEPDPDLCYGSPRYIKVTCTAGIALPVEDTGLYSAMIFQGIANFNRRDLLGFTQVTSEKGSARYISDKGTLLDAVKELIQEYVYYGDGRVCT